ncbi:LysR family transcriptional regulator [Tomitella gaofuii]|nr:LysR family transcriptional regulator [Tomitella gaofuii]
MYTPEETPKPRAVGPDNNFSVQKLEVFCSVVELGGVGRAAEALFVSQPVVSAHLKSLEKHIGAQLFVKDGRSIRLSEPGQTVYRWASDVLRSRRELDKSLESLSAGTAGSVRIAASMSAGNSLLTPVVVDFRRRYRDVDITVTNSSVEVAMETVRAGRADFCVVATDAVVDARSYEAELIGQPPFVLLAAVDDDRVPDRVGAVELAQLPFITPPGGFAIRHSQEAALARLGVKHRHVEIELGSAEAIKQAVSGGLGVALLWRVSARQELARGELREITIAGPPIRDKLYFVTRSRKRLTPVQQRLRRAITESIPDLLEA